MKHIASLSGSEAANGRCGDLLKRRILKGCELFDLMQLAAVNWR